MTMIDLEPTSGLGLSPANRTAAALSRQHGRVIRRGDSIATPQLVIAATLCPRLLSIFGVLRISLLARDGLGGRHSCRSASPSVEKFCRRTAARRRHLQPTRAAVEATRGRCRAARAIVIIRGLPSPAAGIGRSQMTVIDRCCEGFGPATRRQQKTRAAGAGGRNLLRQFRQLTRILYWRQGACSAQTRISQDAPRAAGHSGNFRHLRRRPVSAPGAREGPQLETVGADHRARTRRGHPHRLQQDIHPRIVIVHRQEL
jgi:hypothetical protein